MSDDGHYKWNGSDWQPVDGSGSGGETAAEPDSVSTDPNERQVLINREDYPELFYLLGFDSWEAWARDIGLDLEYLQSDDDGLYV